MSKEPPKKNPPPTPAPTHGTDKIIANKMERPGPWPSPPPPTPKKDK